MPPQMYNDLLSTVEDKLRLLEKACCETRISDGPLHSSLQFHNALTSRRIQRELINPAFDS